MPDSRAEREADLRTYYDNEAADRRDKHLPVARVQHRDAFIELLRRERRGSVVEIRVSDSGSGPNAEAQLGLFDKFAKGTRPSVRGSGLGLFIVRELARSQGGDAWFEAPTTFAFSLPAAD